MRTLSNNTSTKQRVACFLEALPELLRSAKEYENKKTFPNNFRKPKKH
jgi:hypothetical protein